MAHNRRPTNNNNNNENDFSAAGLQMPASLASAGYQALRTSKDIQQPQQPQQLGEPMTFITDQGRYWSGTCYYVTIAILIALIVLAAVLSGVIARHGALEHGDRTKCGTRWIREGDWCGNVILAGMGSSTTSTLRRLTTDPNMKVLGIESGQDFINAPEANIVINLFNFGDLIPNFPNKYHWQMPTEPDAGLGGRSDLQDGGRALSGGSQLNFGVMIRGSIANWNEFDASLGSPGYFDGAAMTAVFESLEDFNGHGQILDLTTRGDGSSPTQTWKVDSVPRAPLAGTDSESFVKLMVAAFPGENDYRDQSYNTPGYDTGIFAHIDLLIDHATTSPLYRWSGRKAFLGPDVMNQATYT